MTLYTRNSSHTPLPTFRKDERDGIQHPSSHEDKKHQHQILEHLKTPSERKVYEYLSGLTGSAHSATICKACSLDAKAVTFALASLLRQKLIGYRGHGLYQCR